MPLNPVPEHRVLIWKWTKTATGDGLWYKPNMQGYTEDVTQAGLYDRAEAEKHVRGRGSDEVEVVAYGSDRMKGLLSRVHSMALRAYGLCETLCEREAERDAARGKVQEVTDWYNKMVDERDFWQKLAGENADKGREYKDRVEELEAQAQEQCDEAAFQHGMDPLPCCGSNSCDIRPPPGQGNNGPCRCEESALRMAVRKLRKERMAYISALRSVRQAKQEVEAAVVGKAVVLMELQEKFNGLEQAFVREVEHGRKKQERVRELETLSETLKQRVLKALGLGEGDMGQGWGWAIQAVEELRNRKALKDTNAPVKAEEAKS